MQGSPRIDELRQKFHENPRRYFAPLANEYRKAGDPEQAIAICRAHLAQQPGHMSGHVVYAQSLYDAGRTDESHVVFEKALSLDPDNAIVLRSLGDIARQRGDSTEAVHWYSRAVDADPHDTVVAAYIAELSEPLTADTPAPTEEKIDEPAPEAVAVAEPSAELSPEPTTEPAAGTVALDDEAERQPDIDPNAVAQLQAGDDSSVFMTRTIAELYATQGYRDAALDIYRKLEASHPDDANISNRIRELATADAAIEPAVEPVTAPASEPDPDAAIEPSADPNADWRPESIPQMQPVDFGPVDNEQSELPSDEATAGLNAFAEATDSEADLRFSDPDEPLPSDPDHDSAAASPAATPSSHFTESGIGAGDQWDTDEWGAGFSSEDAVPTPEPIPAMGEQQVQPDGWRMDAPAAAAEEHHLVAYAPEAAAVDEPTPPGPTGPTMREFFATLGARRPRSEPAAATIASSPDAAAGDSVDTLPFASDAFASLFSESDVTEEDSRAAFALSGALSSHTPAQMPSPPHATPAAGSDSLAAENVQPEQSSLAAQESEEDIRKFREWLDGLADT